MPIKVLKLCSEKKDEPDNVEVTKQTNIIGDYQRNGNPGSSKFILKSVTYGIKEFGPAVKDLVQIKAKVLLIKKLRQFMFLE